MIEMRVTREGGFSSWKTAARQCLVGNVPPEQILWLDGDADSLFQCDTAHRYDQDQAKAFKVPRDFIDKAEAALCHSSADRLDLLYRLLWRLQGNSRLLDQAADRDVSALRDIVKSVSRDKHKMKAFVRFRDVSIGSGKRKFVAWFEPQHHIVEATAPFFARRFADMDWAILTPKGSAQFSDAQLKFGPATRKPDIPADGVEELWTCYFSNIFNPSRLKVKAMQSEMPKKYWKNLPEARLIPDLIATAAQRSRDMQQRMPTPEMPHVRRFVAKTVDRPASSIQSFASLENLATAAQSCTRCTLCHQATQTVTGRGFPQAALMLVGEQPGDVEDLQGEPFVGPAGKLLRDIVDDAGLMWDDLFVTNAVKHFKFTVHGKRRIHAKPSTSEIDMCKWWVNEEIRMVQPQVIVGLGATALYALTGVGAHVSNRRGKLEMTQSGIAVMPTYHPSAILRHPDPLVASTMKQQLRDDLRAASQMVKPALVTHDDAVPSRIT